MSAQPDYKNVNVKDLLEQAQNSIDNHQDETPVAETVWTDEQKNGVNKHIVKARMKYRMSQLKARRGGKGRYELTKQKLDLKRTSGTTPSTETVGQKVTTTSKDHVNSDTIATAPNKAKLKRAKKAKKAAEKRKLAEKQKELEAKTVFEVPGTGTEYDTVRLHLDDDANDTKL